MRDIKASTFSVSVYDMMPQKLTKRLSKRMYVQVYDGYLDQIKCQKEVVRAMLLDATIDPAAKMNLINLLERLSLSYHFENEIEGQLEQLFDARPNLDVSDFDLYTIALQFRIFRQHGYRVLVVSA